MKSKNVARAALDTRRNELAAEEADIAESRVRFEAERLVDFYDKLGDRQVSNMLHPCTNPDAIPREGCRGGSNNHSAFQELREDHRRNDRRCASTHFVAFG